MNRAIFTFAKKPAVSRIEIGFKHGKMHVFIFEGDNQIHLKILPHKIAEWLKSLAE